MHEVHEKNVSFSLTAPENEGNWNEGDFWTSGVNYVNDQTYYRRLSMVDSKSDAAVDKDDRRNMWYRRGKKGELEVHTKPNEVWLTDDGWNDVVKVIVGKKSQKAKKGGQPSSAVDEKQIDVITCEYKSVAAQEKDELKKREKAEEAIWTK